jgi:peroxiredoxin
MEFVALGARAALALVFALAAVAKLLDQPGARRALGDFRVPKPLVVPSGWLLPTAELAIAAALLIQPTAGAGAIAACVLLAAFIAGITGAMARGEAPDCHCFGQVSSSPAGVHTLIRNGLLGSLALVVAIYGPGQDLGAWLSARSAAELGALGLGLLAAGLAGVSIRLWRENRRLRDELAQASEWLDAFPPGLPVGAPAPAFSLPSAAGEEMSLQALLGRGKPVALVFVSPSCRPCVAMLPDLARWQQTLADRLTIALVAAGDVGQTRRLVAEHGLADVLMQHDAEVFRAYRATASPAVVIVSVDGRIGTRIRSSQGIVEAVIRHALQSAEPPHLDGHGTADGESSLAVLQRSGRGVQRA